MNLDNITTIEKSSVKRQNFDLRYSKSTNGFQLSDTFFASKDMSNHGFKFHLAEGGKTPLLSIHPTEDSIFFKGKESSDTKSPKFSYNIMEDTLKDLGLLTDEDHTNFSLEEVGERDGVTYLRIAPYEEVEDVEEAVEESTEDQPEIVDEEVEETEESKDDLVEAEEDPFA